MCRDHIIKTVAATYVAIQTVINRRYIVCTLQVNGISFLAYSCIILIYQLHHMKSSKQLAIAIVLIAGVSTSVKAQKLFFVFAHGQYATPLQSNLKNNYNFGLGAEGGAGIGFGKTFITATVGYSVFDARSGTEAGNLTYVPIKAGFRKYFLPMNLLYIHADAGVANVKVKGGGSSSRFTGDVGAGVKLGPLEAGVAYEGFSQSDPSGFASWLAFKLGWRLGL
jgi:hypothetical protein